MLAIQHGAVNLSQGFPNEPPPREAACAAAGALLAGETSDTADAMAQRLEDQLLRSSSSTPDASPKDSLNQYSFPFGMPALRKAIEAYTETFYPGLPADAEDNLTVVLGATEGFAAACAPACAHTASRTLDLRYPILLLTNPTFESLVCDSSSRSTSCILRSARCGG